MANTQIATDLNDPSTRELSVFKALNRYQPTTNNRMAGLGDSMLDRGDRSGGGVFLKTTSGPLTWVNILCGQRFDYQLANNFGVSGDTLAQMAARVPDVIAAAPAFVVIYSPGTNDITAGTALASMKASLTDDIVAPLLKAGITVIIPPIPPRLASGSGVTTSTAQKKKIALWNNWLQELCAGRPDLIPATWPINRLPYFVETRHYLENRADSTGEPLTGTTIDGLHHSALGAYYVAKAIKEQVLDILYPPRSTKLMSVMDIYDATDNPTGNRHRNSGATANYGLLSGTAGSLVASTGLTPTGSVADLWSAARSVGSSSTSTMVLSKENPRTDDGARSGERQRVVIAISGTGGIAAEKFQFYRTTTTGTSGIAVGDTIYGECAYELASGANIIGIELAGVEAGPGSPQTTADGYRETIFGGTQVFPNVAHKGVLRTPEITLQSGLTGIVWTLTIWMDASSNTGSADVYWSDVSCRSR